MNLFVWKWVGILLIALAFIQCKSEPTYNSVVEEAIKAENEAQSNKDLPFSEESNIDSSDYTETVNLHSTITDPAATTTSTSKTSKDETFVQKERTAPSKKRSLAKIEFDNPIFLYGDITEGDIVEHKFYFTNIGNAPLNIKNASATCGCAIPSYPFIAIENGERGFIGVTFNSVGKSGKQAPAITVVSNASEPVHKLRLSGNVLEKVKEEKVVEKDSTNQSPE